MDVNARHLGFAFFMSRMTEVLALDIYGTQALPLKGFYVGDIKGKGFLRGVDKGDAKNVRTRTCLIILMCAGMRDS